MAEQHQWREIGRICLLQVQIAPLKVGNHRRVYRPEGALRAVETFNLSEQGITAVINGEEVYDMHHVHHPASHNRQSNPVSIGFTSHYTDMRARFGAHMGDGVAGENIIVETEGILTEEDLSRGVAVRNTRGELVTIQHLYAIPPCKPFAGFCLQLADTDQHQARVKTALQYLHTGKRGFCGEPSTPIPHKITINDTLLVAL
ncbi:MAG: hypothetical protein GYB66_16010 [Chloroflexi bacterium]|nr:hypothetical protein [Chloroflexota bacterium]